MPTRYWITIIIIAVSLFCWVGFRCGQDHANMICEETKLDLIERLQN